MYSGKRALASISAAAAVVALLAGCGSGSSSDESTTSPNTSTNPPANNSTANEPSASGGETTSGGGETTGALPDLKGQSVSILGQWTGGEQKAFQAVLDKFNSETGADAKYTPAPGGDLTTVLGAKVAGGTPPDVAILAIPASIAQYANAGKLHPVAEDTAAAVSDNYAGEWAKLATVNGKLYGVPVDASNKSTVWYATKAFDDAGITDTPETWEDFIADAKTLSNSGVKVPISVAGGDGWTLTDWFENVYIRTAGVEMYDKLTHHEIPWTDPSVTTALNTLKQVWGDPTLIGDPNEALKVTFEASVDNVFKANPTSAIVYEASFVATTITGDKNPAKVGVDAKFFPFPSINGSDPVLEAAGDFAVAFSDNPAIQPLLQYLASAEAAKILVGTEGSGFLSANKNLKPSDYNDETSGSLGEQIVSVGDNFRFDMSDQAPAAFGGTPNKGEWADLQTFLKTGDVATAQKQLEAHAAAEKWD